MNTSMDILGVKNEFGPLVFYLFGPSVKNSVLRFSIYLVLRIRSTVPVRFLAVEFGNIRKSNLVIFFRSS